MFRAKRVEAAWLRDECRLNGFEEFYDSCWQDRGDSCVMAVESETREINKEVVFCNTGGTGKCKFKEEVITCKPSLNPVQAVVNWVSEENKKLGGLVYEVYLEPGDFTVEQKAGCVFGGSSCNGFVQNKGGKEVPNFFGQERYGVQVPSFTRIRGTNRGNEWVSRFYISKESYGAFGESFVKGGGAKGGGVNGLMVLTNVLGEGSVAPGTPEKEIKLYEESMANPVKQVIIEKIHFLGVGGMEERKQSVNIPTDYYCAAPECGYIYTSTYAIVGKRIKGENVIIRKNRMELFPAFVFMGHFFNMFSSSLPQDLFKDGTITSIPVSGQADSPIEISYNLMEKAIGADSVIVGGDYIDITNNTVRNSFNDWYGNPAGISVYQDSSQVRVEGNRIEGFLTGINFEGLFALSKPEWGMGEGVINNWDRVARGNVIKDNILLKTVTCMSIQRQIGVTITGNYCEADKERMGRLMEKSFYYPESKYTFLKGLLGRVPGQKEAYDMNTALLGWGIHLRTSQGAVIWDNTFKGYPKGFLMHNMNILDGGMKDDILGYNLFETNTQESQTYITKVQSEGLTDNFYGVYWAAAGGREPQNVRMCQSNALPFKGGDREYQNRNLAGQMINADCGNFDLIIPSRAPTQTPAPAKRVISPTPTSQSCLVCPGKTTKTKGDANCDGVIDFADYGVWRREYFDEGGRSGGVKENWQSNFDCSRDGNKQVTGADFQVWLSSCVIDPKGRCN
jgi:hypothetical protein